MRIVIVGAGRTGTQLARHLIQEKHEVSLIESNEERARHASNRLDCLVLHDEGNSLQALEDAGIAKADALICITESDEVNMIICGLAASRRSGLIKIARVRNNDYVTLNQAAGRGAVRFHKKEDVSEKNSVLGIDYFIHPDIEAARAVLSALSHGAAGNVLAFPGTDYELGSLDVVKGSSFDGLCLKDFRGIVREESLITLVERGHESFLPSGDTVLEQGDRIHILAGEENMDRIFRLGGRAETPLRRIGIVGGGRIGSLIVEGLLGKTGEHRLSEGILGAEIFQKGILQTGTSFFKSLVLKSSRRVIVIERNYTVCKDLAARFPDALILNEDVSDESFIAEERIGTLDLIITATANQELNMITALYLKSRGVGRAVALVSGSGYETIARQLGVDVVIQMKSVVVDSILSHLMGGTVRNIHRFGDGSVGIIELEIGEDSPAAEKNIAEFRLPSGGLVMLARRGKTAFIPRGDYCFRAGDKIILTAKNGSEAELEKFFGAGSKEKEKEES